MNRFPHYLLPAFLVVLAIPSSQVAAESHAVCEAYANEAVQAFQASRQHNCGWSNARWHDNRQAHYDWCRSAPSDWVANEAAFRASNLRVCRREPGAETCHEYASIAVSTQRSNLGGNCGFTGARWGDSYDHHLAWCMTVPSDVAAREANIRAAMLGVCGGGDRFRRCDAYARDAENQVREANERGCGFSGPRWTPLYEDHLAWCVSQPAEVAAQESRERDGPLSQCRTQLPHGPTPEACNWTANVTTDACANVDGSPSSASGTSHTGCGATEEAATDRAKAGVPLPLSEGEYPAPGTCTYSVDARPGCGCG